MAIDEKILGGKAISGELLRVVEAALARNESVLGILPTLSGNAVAATSARLVFATKEQIDLELDYEAITAMEVRTGWWSRGITFATEEGEIECDVEDKEVVTAFGDIVRQRAPHIEVPEDGGGLMGRVKGVVDTATGQDIRKFEEFVEESTTVLVGLHRDQTVQAEKQSELDSGIEDVRQAQEALDAKQAQLEDGMRDVRQAQEAIDAKLANLDESIGELRERFDEFTSKWVQEPATEGPSLNRVVLAVSLAAIVLSFVSVVLGLV